MSCSVTYTATQGLKLQGDEIGAWMVSTTDDNQPLIADNFANTSGWTAYNSTPVIESGRLKIALTSNDGGVYRTYATTVGQAYAVYCDAEGGTGQAKVLAGTSIGSGALASTILAAGETGKAALVFVATGSTTYLSLQGELSGQTAFFDNFYLLPAETIGVDETTRLETNGDFDASISNWTDNSSGGGSIAWNASGYLELNATTGTARAYQGITTVVGQAYLVTITKVDAAGNLNAQAATTGGGADLRAINYGTSADTYSYIVIATGTTTYFQVACDNGNTTQITSIKVQKTGNLVENHDFSDSTVKSWTEGTGWTISGGVATATAVNSGLLQYINLVAGKSYVVTFTISGYSAGHVYPRLTGGTSSDGTNRSANGTYTETLIANDGNTGLNIYPGSTFTGIIDNVSIRLAVPDISTYENGREVHGEIAKAPVAAGSELQAYGNFSADNFLEQPYNSDFAFGTGDWCFSFWLIASSDINYRELLHYGYHDGTSWSGSAISIRITNASVLQVRLTDDGFTTVDTKTCTTIVDDGQPRLVTVQRFGSSFYIYLNDTLEASQAITNASGSLSNSNATLIIGVQPNYVNWLENGLITLPRIRLDDLTAAQIKAIYDSEKHLFDAYSMFTQVGESYTLDIAPQAFTPSTDHVRNKSTALGGQRETLFFRNDKFWGITTGYTLDIGFDPINRFIDSVAEGQTFTLTPPGALNWEKSVTLESDSYQEARVGSSLYLTASFRVKGAP